MFEGFERKTIAVDGIDIACDVGGEGPPLLSRSRQPRHRRHPS